MTMNDDSPNIFADDWRECLAAHYMHVIRTEDHVTRPTLTQILHDAGFNDGELNELQVRATIRAEDMPDGFVPDMDILDAHHDHAHEHNEAHPEEASHIFPTAVAPEEAFEAEEEDILTTYDELLEGVNNNEDEAITKPQPDEQKPDSNASQLSLF